MKHITTLAVIALFALALVLDRSNVRFLPAVDGGNASLVTGLVLASPVFGLLYLLSRFVRWHAGFHRRMRGK